MATAAIMVLIFPGNGYGLVVTANAILDKRGYECYETTVADKYVSRGNPQRITWSYSHGHSNRKVKVNQ